MYQEALFSNELKAYNASSEKNMPEHGSKDTHYTLTVMENLVEEESANCTEFFMSSWNVKITLSSFPVDHHKELEQTLPDDEIKIFGQLNKVNIQT